jgi:hypothetical protein
MSVIVDIVPHSCGTARNCFSGTTVWRELRIRVRKSHIVFKTWRDRGYIKRLRQRAGCCKSVLSCHPRESGTADLDNSGVCGDRRNGRWRGVARLSRAGHTEETTEALAAQYEQTSYQPGYRTVIHGVSEYEAPHTASHPLAVALLPFGSSGSIHLAE